MIHKHELTNCSEGKTGELIINWIIVLIFHISFIRKTSDGNNFSFCLFNIFAGILVSHNFHWFIFYFLDHIFAYILIIFIGLLFSYTFLIFLFIIIIFIGLIFLYFFKTYFFPIVSKLFIKSLWFSYFSLGLIFMPEIWTGRTLNPRAEWVQGI